MRTAAKRETSSPLVPSRRHQLPRIAPPRTMPTLLPQELAQLRLCLLQPKRHIHFAIQCCRRIELLACFTEFACHAEERAKAEVAAGNQRAETARRGDLQGLAEARFRQPGIEPLWMDRN